MLSQLKSSIRRGGSYVLNDGRNIEDYGIAQGNTLHIYVVLETEGGGYSRHLTYHNLVAQTLIHGNSSHCISGHI